MRQIEFRGKRLDNGEWVYGNLQVHLVDGYLDQSEKKYYIEYNYMDKHGKVFRDSYEVDPSTIGQFTGLVDKNKKRIYEGDIIECVGIYNQKHFKTEVFWDEFGACFIFQEDSNNCQITLDSITNGGIYIAEVIGTIYNKENE